MEKKSKNTVHWCGARNYDLSAEHADLHTDLADLEAKENQVGNTRSKMSILIGSGKLM